MRVLTGEYELHPRFWIEFISASNPPQPTASLRPALPELIVAGGRNGMDWIESLRCFERTNGEEMREMLFRFRSWEFCGDTSGLSF